MGSREGAAWIEERSPAVWESQFDENSPHESREHMDPSAHDDHDCRWFYFRIRVPGDLEDMEEGEEIITTEGELEMAVRADNEFLPTGHENEHIFRAWGEDVTVTMTRAGDAWTVVAEGQMTFNEAYRGCGKRNPKGDCVGTWAYVYPLWGGSYPLTFEATWEKTP